MSSGTSATNLQSVQKAKKKLIKYLKRVQTAPQDILAREAPRIEAEAKLLTPYESGRLERNVYCRVSRNQRAPGLNLGASARHNNFNYASIQHENEAYKHPVKGQAHYLKIPFDKGVRRIKYAIDKELKYNAGN